MSTREVIFGRGLKQVNLAALAEKTGIPKRTLFNYREAPETIPLGKLRLIVKALGLRPEEVLK